MEENPELGNEEKHFSSHGEVGLETDQDMEIATRANKSLYESGGTAKNRKDDEESLNVEIIDIVTTDFLINEDIIVDDNSKGLESGGDTEEIESGDKEVEPDDDNEEIKPFYPNARVLFPSPLGRVLDGSVVIGNLQVSQNN